MTTTLSSTGGGQPGITGTILTASCPGFIAQYFSRSRLHHLSTWKASWSDYVSQYQQQHQKHYKASHASKDGKDYYRVIMHIDMDCFFASVGIRDRPGLKDKPVVVAHTMASVTSSSSSGIDHASTSELASCNYPARKYGIRNGMFLGQAQALCPELVVIPYEYEKYDAVSKVLYHILLMHSDYVQAVSCDEAYIDVTFKVQQMLEAQGLSLKAEHRSAIPNTLGKRSYDHGNCEDEEDLDDHDAFQRLQMKMDSTSRPKMNPTTAVLERADQISLDIAQRIRKEIFDQTGCVASIGIGSNMLLARIATQKAKPNNVYSTLQQKDISSALSNLPIRDLPGVGYVTAKKCEEILKLRTCGDIIVPNSMLSTKLSSLGKDGILSLLQKELGAKTGLTIYEFAHGKDNRTLSNMVRQSIGSDINWGIRFTKQEEIDRFLLEFCQEVHNRLMALKPLGDSSADAKNFIISPSTFIVSHIIVCVKKKQYEGEPGKFLGCGPCQDLSKSFVVNKKTAINLLLTSNISANSEEEREPVGCKLLNHIVTTLYKEIGVEILDVRGVGIHLKRDMTNAMLEDGLNSVKSSKLTSFFQGSYASSSSITDKETEIEDEDLFGLIDTTDVDHFQQQDYDVESKKPEPVLNEINSSPSRPIENKIMNSPPKRISEDGIITSPSKRLKLLQQQKQESLIRAFLKNPKNNNKSGESEITSKVSADRNAKELSNTFSRQSAPASLFLEDDIAEGEEVRKHGTDNSLNQKQLHDVIELLDSQPSQAQSNLKSEKNDVDRLNSCNQIDESVLKELPEDIRKEVLQGLRNTNTGASTSATNVKFSPQKKNAPNDTSKEKKSLITTFFHNNGGKSSTQSINSVSKSPNTSSNNVSNNNSLGKPSSSWNLEKEIKLLRSMTKSDEEFNNLVDVSVLRALPTEIVKEQVDELKRQLKTSTFKK